MRKASGKIRISIAGENLTNGSQGQRQGPNQACGELPNSSGE